MCSPWDADAASGLVLVGAAAKFQARQASVQGVLPFPSRDEEKPCQHHLRTPLQPLHKLADVTLRKAGRDTSDLGSRGEVVLWRGRVSGERGEHPAGRRQPTGSADAQGQACPPGGGGNGNPAEPKSLGLVSKIIRKLGQFVLQPQPQGQGPRQEMTVGGLPTRAAQKPVDPPPTPLQPGPTQAALGAGWELGHSGHGSIPAGEGPVPPVPMFPCKDGTLRTEA